MTIRTLTAVLGALVLPALPGCEAEPAPIGEVVTVQHIADGDTFTARDAAGVRVRVRVLGIDAPEAATDDKPAECGAGQARAALASLLTVGAPVTLELDPKTEPTDRYGRRLAYVAANGRDVGAELIANGMAAAWQPRSAATHARADRYRAAQNAAQEAHAGLWATCTSIGR